MPKGPVTDHSVPSKHHIGRLIPQTSRLIPENGRLVPETGRARAWVGRWTGAGVLTGGCLGSCYGFLVGLIFLFAYGVGFVPLSFAIGGAIGAIAGMFTGLLIGLVQVLLRRTPIPVPVIPVAVTEITLLPLQLLAAYAGWQLLAAVFIYIPSVLALGAAAVLGFRLPPASHPLRGAPDPEAPSRGHIQPFGATGLRLLSYRRWRYRPAQRRARIASGRR